MSPLSLIRNTAFSILLFATASPASNYYWVGNSGNWSDYNGHWATTSGGMVYYNQAPGSGDDVIFDNNSFTSTGAVVNIDGSIAMCRSFTVMSSVANNPTFQNDPTNSFLRVYGSFTLQPNIQWSVNFPSVIEMDAPSGVQNIKCAAHSFANMDLKGNATWNQTDSIRAVVLTLTNGTFITNNYSLSVGQMNFSNVNSTSFLGGTSGIWCSTWNAMTHSLTTMDMDSAVVTIYDAFLNSGGRHFHKLINPSSNQVQYGCDSCIIDTLLALGGWTQMSNIHSTIHYLYSSSNFIFYNPNHADYAEFRTYTRFDQYGSSDFDTLYFNNGGAYVGLYPGVVVTINDTMYTANSACADLVNISSQVPGQQAGFYKASGSVVCEHLLLTDITATGGASFTANNSVDNGNNSGWTINALPMQTWYWVGNSGNWSDPAHWSLTSGGSSAGCLPSSNDSIVFDQNSFSGPGATVMIDIATLNIRSLDAQNVTQQFYMNSTQVSFNNQFINCSGNFMLSPLMDWTFPNIILNMVATSRTNHLRLAGNTIRDLNFTGTANFVISDTLNANNIEIDRGNIYFANNYVNVGTFTSPFSSIRTIHFGHSVLNAGTFGLSTNASGLTVLGDSCRINISMNFSNQNNCVLDTVTASSTSTLNNVGMDLVAGTIKHLIADYPAYLNYSTGLYKHVLANKRITLNSPNGHIEYLDARNTVEIPNNYTVDTLVMNNPGYSVDLNIPHVLTINSLVANGSCSSVLSIVGSGVATSSADQSFIVSNSPSISADGLIVSNIDASGSATFTATNSTAVGHVTGWNITSSSSPQTFYWVNGTGSWFDPSHWSLTSGGTAGTCIPGILDDVIFDGASFTGNDSVNLGDGVAYCHNIDASSITTDPVFFGTVSFYPVPFTALRVSGSMHLSPQIQWIYEGYVQFIGTERNRQIGAAGLPFSGLEFDGLGGSYMLTDSLTYLYRGEMTGGFLNTNGYLVRGFSSLDISDSIQFSTSRVILDQSQFNGQSNPAWNVFVDADSAFITCQNASGNNIHFGHLDMDGYPNNTSLIDLANCQIDLLTTQNIDCSIYTIDSLTIDHAVFSSKITVNSPTRIHNCDLRNDATFNMNMNFDTLLINNPSHSTVFHSDSVVTVNNLLQTNGSASYMLNISSSSPGTQATISVPSDTVCMEYVNFTDINATGGAVFYAGFYSHDLGGNTGLNFTACTLPMSNVWPGDANNDLTVDNNDLLSIGLAFNELGYVRPGATINWQAESCLDWNRIFASGVNISHADCDGNGTIDSTDVTAVYQNYGLNHPALIGPASPPQSPYSGENIYLDPVVFNYNQGNFVTIPVKLGTSGDPADNIYGTAYKITYDQSKIVSGSVYMTYPSSWFTPNGNKVSFQKDFYSSGRIDDAQSRINLTNVTGYGTIAYLHFQIDPTATGQIDLNIINVSAVDKDENAITLIPIGTTIFIVPLGTVTTDATSDLEVFPVPSAGDFTVSYLLSNTSDVKIELFDITGKCIYSDVMKDQLGEFTKIISGELLENGIYELRFTSASGVESRRIIKAE